MNKKAVIAALEEIALLLELKGENPFKIRAYTNAARTLRNLDQDLDELVQAGELGNLKGFGDALVGKISELVTTDQLEYLNDLRAEFPPSLQDLLTIPGLGPKKIKLFYMELGVDSIDALADACADGSVAALPGCGDKTAAKLLDAIERVRAHAGLFLFAQARAAADQVAAELRRCPELKRLEVAGSLRRFKEMTKDADLLGAAAQPGPVMQAFVDLPFVQTVLGHGETKSSVVLNNGLQVDLRLVPENVFPYALHHFTGSKDHNIAMRRRAGDKGRKLSEWGLFEADDSRVPCRREADIFAALELHYIPPELREGAGEIEHAEQAPCPDLVELSDYRGSLHNHSTASDGAESIENLIAHARELGHRMLAVTDHSRASFQANGLDEDRLQAQVDRINALQADLADFTLFSGIECDIKTDGELDLDDAILQAVDLVIVSVHSAFTRSEEEQTARVIRAIEHPQTNILAHPTGRLLPRREPYNINLDKVIDAAIANHVALELNCQPSRLDLPWNVWRRARDKGLRCSLNPDAHSLDDFRHVEYGIGFARKGWLTADDIINCWPPERLQNFLNP